MKYFISLFLLLSIVACDKSRFSDGMFAKIETDRGAIVVKLYYVDTPLTVSSFVNLAEGTSKKVSDSLVGKKFYDGLPFHRVVPGFVIQGGDILRNGAGNPGYTFDDEFPKDSLGALLHTHKGKGILSMANSGPKTNGSQFFITLDKTPWLDGKHTVFGKVIEGLDVLDSIQQGDIMNNVTILRKGRVAENFSFENAITELEIKKLEAEKLLKMERTKDSLKFSTRMKEPSALKLASGLKILHLEKGGGKKLSYGDRVKVNYTGYFVDGNIFDTSKKRNMPLEFTLGVDRVIEGLTEGVSLVRRGGKARLFVPYQLAYGAAGYGPIPQKENLIFDIEIVK